MKRQKFARFFITILLISYLCQPLTNVFACSNSTGVTRKDKKVASKICGVFKEIPDILLVSVQESILYVDISRQFFDAMRIDKLSGTKLVKSWMNGMRQETGFKAVTVWVYVDKEKVIEGETSFWGEDKVKFLF